MVQGLVRKSNQTKSKGISIKTDGRRVSLTIPSNPPPIDSGQYSVEVGDERSQCKVSVEGKSFVNFVHECQCTPVPQIKGKYEDTRSRFRTRYHTGLTM